MTKNTTYTERFTIDFISKKIIGTQASFNKASKGTGEIYEELASKIARHPNFEVAVKEQKKHITKAKRTYDGMDFKFMEAYITTQKIADQLICTIDSIGLFWLRVIHNFHLSERENHLSIPLRLLHRYRPTYLAQR